MKNVLILTCLGLAVVGEIVFCLTSKAAEIRESVEPADNLFPKRKCVGEFKNGLPNGLFKFLDENGKLILTEEYVNGKVHGKRLCYYPSGKKFSEMTFINGLAEGETKTWFEDGTVAHQTTMKNGLPDGIQTSYYTNGNKSNETSLLKAVTHGTCRYYLPDGRLYGLSTFENGIETSKRVIIEPTQQEYSTILKEAKFSTVLKDHWPANNVNREIKVGDQVEVEWKGKWYPAKVLRIEKRGYFIHYDNHDNSWDEYVWKDRIRSSQN